MSWLTAPWQELAIVAAHRVGNLLRGEPGPVPPLVAEGLSDATSFADRRDGQA